jgi:hypothetical protein
VLSLQVDDISYGRRRVVIRKRDNHPRGARGKSRAERVVDLHEPRTLDAVSRYMMHERPLDALSPFECGHLTWPHFGRRSSRILAPAGW